MFVCLKVQSGGSWKIVTGVDQPRQRQIRSDYLRKFQQVSQHGQMESRATRQILSRVRRRGYCISSAHGGNPGGRPIKALSSLHPHQPQAQGKPLLT